MDTQGQRSPVDDDGPDTLAYAIGYICEHLSEIRALAERRGDQDILARLLAAISAGQAVTALSPMVDELHKALQRSGDALGIYGHTGRGEQHGVVPEGMGPRREAEVVFLCPRARCSRYWIPDSDAKASPVCDVYAEPLRWERL